MGAGKARISPKVVRITDEETGESYTVDQDKVFESRVARRYKDGRKKFNMTSDEVQEYCREHDIILSFGWGLLDTDRVDLIDSSMADIVDEDLRYHIYKSAKILVTIRERLRELGIDKTFGANYLFFDISTLHGGSMEPNIAGEIDYYDDRISINVEEENVLNLRALDYFRWLNRNRNADPSTYPRESPNLYEQMYYLGNERKRTEDSWNVLSSTYAMDTVAHEVGHAVQEALGNMRY